jgi:hypothetical protein
MQPQATLTARRRDLRLDLFLGIANWFIFLDHIPHNVASWITVRNYGFSGAVDIFIFISGYTAAIVYAKIMVERGFIVGATRLFKQAWQLYAAYIVLFVIYIVVIGDVAARYAVPDIIYEFNIAGLIDHPIRILAHGLMLQSRPLNLDLLQLYIILVALFPPVLWIMLRYPKVAMGASITLYVVARQLEWNFPSYPDGNLPLNPFCWQLLFVIGAWVALGGTKRWQPLPRFPMLRYLGIGYLIFALAMTMAGHFPELGKMLPAWLFDAFNPNDRTNLAPYRVLHFIVLAFFVTRFVTKDWHGLKWQIFQPIIRCGQQSVAVFCVGVFLSFAGHFALIVSSDSLMIQIFVSLTGIAIMTLAAYFVSWPRQQDEAFRTAAINVHG